MALVDAVLPSAAMYMWNVESCHRTVGAAARMQPGPDHVATSTVYATAHMCTVHSLSCTRATPYPAAVFATAFHIASAAYDICMRTSACTPTKHGCRLICTAICGFTFSGLQAGMQ